MTVDQIKEEIARMLKDNDPADLKYFDAITKSFYEGTRSALLNLAALIQMSEESL